MWFYWLINKNFKATTKLAVQRRTFISQAQKCWSSIKTVYTTGVAGALTASDLIFTVHFGIT